jgi:hypothetical protein
MPAGNMMLFDAEGRIKHYPSPEAIVAEFFDLRLDYYERRRQALLKVRRAGLSLHAWSTACHCIAVHRSCCMR